MVDISNRTKYIKLFVPLNTFLTKNSEIKLNCHVKFLKKSIIQSRLKTVGPATRRNPDWRVVMTNYIKHIRWNGSIRDTQIISALRYWTDTLLTQNIAIECQCISRDQSHQYINFLGQMQIPVEIFMDCSKHGERMGLNVYIENQKPNSLLVCQTITQPFFMRHSALYVYPN